MNLFLKRDLRSERFTLGSLMIEDQFECWTLEDKERDLSNGCENKVKAETAIPPGTYPLILSFSNRFKKYMPEIINVPCFTGIRIHSGNKPEDSEGCILVGCEKSIGGQIFKSKIAFDLLMRRLKAVEKKEKITITIT